MNHITEKTVFSRLLEANKKPMVMCTTFHSDGRKPDFVTRKGAILDEDSEVVARFLDFGYIAEKLSFDRLPLSDQTPIFICAQTGTGKTTLIFESLYPAIRKQGKRLLVLASRSALKTKIKYDAIRAAKTGQEELLTVKGIEQEHHFGKIDVFSYQDFAVGSRFRDNRAEITTLMSEYGAVVFDEAHFFTADADFNRSTEYILDFLLGLAHAKRIPRIYLTATPEVVFDHIARKEQALGRCTDMYSRAQEVYNELSFTKFQMQLFCFKKCYKYVKASTFKDIAELSEYINNSKCKKWLVFVDCIAKGENIKESLSKLDKKVIFLNSGTLHNANNQDAQRVIDGLVNQEDIFCDILITTKCLDVGINIKTEGVNIVSFLTDRVDFIQGIGRKRVIKNNEEVNLFLPEYTSKDVKRWVSQTNRRLKEFEDTCKYAPEGSLAEESEYPNPVYVEHGRTHHNHLALAKLHYHLKELELLHSQLTGCDSQDTQIIFAYFLSWLELESKPLSGFVDDMKKEMSKIVQEYLNKSPLNEAEFQEFAEKIVKIYGDPRKDTRKERSPFNTQTVNSIISQIGTTCSGKTINGKKQYRFTLKEADF